MCKVGVVGGTGYTAGELLRLLVNHPQLEIDFVYSHSKPGEFVAEVHQDLLGTDLRFTDQVNENVEVLFLCLGHGNSAKFLSNHIFSSSTKIIDLSNDFRLNKDASFQGLDFQYGLVDVFKEEVKSAKHIANPGCFATAIQLALAPVAKAGLLNEQSIHINAVTGSTGAGGGLSPTSHFSYRNNNLSVYKAFQHQHLGEIKETIGKLANTDPEIHFLPVRGDFTRGIFASIYLNFSGKEEEALAAFQAFYGNAPFVHLVPQVHLKQVVNTNNVALSVEVIDGKLLICCAIDNLLKGAAGQAIENVNLMYNWPQDAGLNLKANYF